MKTVTYRGSNDPRDPSNFYCMGEYELTQGIPVDVPDEVARELEAIEGHAFEVEGAKTEPTSLIQTEPVKGKNEED